MRTPRNTNTANVRAPQQLPHRHPTERISRDGFFRNRSRSRLRMPMPVSSQEGAAIEISEESADEDAQMDTAVSSSSVPVPVPVAAAATVTVTATINRTTTPIPNRRHRGRRPSIISIASSSRSTRSAARTSRRPSAPPVARSSSRNTLNQPGSFDVGGTSGTVQENVEIEMEMGTEELVPDRRRERSDSPLTPLPEEQVSLPFLSCYKYYESLIVQTVKAENRFWDKVVGNVPASPASTSSSTATSTSPTGPLPSSLDLDWDVIDPAPSPYSQVDHSSIRNPLANNVPTGNTDADRLVTSAPWMVEIDGVMVNFSDSLRESVTPPNGTATPSPTSTGNATPTFPQRIMIDDFVLDLDALLDDASSASPPRPTIATPRSAVADQGGLAFHSPTPPIMSPTSDYNNNLARSTSRLPSASPRLSNSMLFREETLHSSPSLPVALSDGSAAQFVTEKNPPPNIGLPPLNDSYLTAATSEQGALAELLGQSRIDPHLCSPLAYMRFPSSSDEKASMETWTSLYRDSNGSRIETFLLKYHQQSTAFENDMETLSNLRYRKSSTKAASSILLNIARCEACHGTFPVPSVAGEPVCSRCIFVFQLLGSQVGAFSKYVSDRRAVIVEDEMHIRHLLCEGR